MNEMNQRVILTKRLLKEALLRLLEKKSLERISITELCKEAGINRATFYRHYELPRDLLIEIQAEFLEEMMKSFREPLSEKVIERCYAYFWEHADLVKIFMQYNLDANISKIFDILYQNMRNAKAFRFLDTEDSQLLYAFLAGGGYFLLRQWLMADIQKTPKEITEITFSIINKETVFKK